MDGVDEVIKRARIEVLKNTFISRKPNSMYLIEKDLKEGKLIIKDRRKIRYDLH